MLAAGVGSQEEVVVWVVVMVVVVVKVETALRRPSLSELSPARADTRRYRPLAKGTHKDCLNKESRDNSGPLCLETLTVPL